MIVVDASVAVKWFIREDKSDLALQLVQGRCKLVSPALTKYEVAGSFVRKFREQHISLEDAVLYRDRWLHAVTTNVIRLDDDTRDIVGGSEIATDLAHPLADCVYLAMAHRLGIPLVTADEVFAKKARARFDQVLNIPQALALAA